MTALFLAAVLASAAQPAGQPAGQPAAPAAPAAGRLELQVSGWRVRSALAQGVTVQEVAQRLEKTLGVPVKLAPALAKRPVALSLKNRKLDELLLALAPGAEVELRSTASNDPILLKVYLLGEADGTGSALVLGPQGSVGFVIEGNTEDEEDAPPKPKEQPAEGPFLRVTAEDGRVTISSRQQRIPAILFEAATALGVPFFMRAPEAPTLDQFDAAQVLPSELPGLLGEGVVVEVRRNLGSGQEKALRILFEARS